MDIEGRFWCAPFVAVHLAGGEINSAPRVRAGKRFCFSPRTAVESEWGPVRDLAS